MQAKIAEGSAREKSLRDEAERLARQLDAANAQVDDLLSQGLRGGKQLLAQPAASPRLSSSAAAQLTSVCSPAKENTRTGDTMGVSEQQQLAASVNPEDGPAVLELNERVCKEGRGGLGLVEAAARADVGELMQGWLSSSSSLWDVPPAREGEDAAPKRDLNPLSTWQQSAAWGGDAEACKLQGILEDWCLALVCSSRATSMPLAIARVVNLCSRSSIALQARGRSAVPDCRPNVSSPPAPSGDGGGYEETVTMSREHVRAQIDHARREVLYQV